jgi:tryptophanyl-tRNA synthetase
MTIPGLDGRKMSKSYDNHIPVFADEASIKKRIMAIKTDSTPVEAPKSLNGNLLGEVFKYFASKEQYVDLEARLQRGGLGWGHAKQQLFETLMSSLKEERARYAEIRSNVPELEKTLLQGAKRAFEIALPVLNRVRKAMGINTYGYRLA